VRLELREKRLFLDDFASLAGGDVATGTGPAVADLTATPQTLPVEMVVEVDPSQTRLMTTITVGKTGTFTKEIPLGGPPTSFIVRCGILKSPQAPVKAGTDAGFVSYAVRIDDVKLQLCRRKP